MRASSYQSCRSWGYCWKCADVGQNSIHSPPVSRRHITVVSDECVFVMPHFTVHTAAATDDDGDADHGDDGNDVDGDVDAARDLGRLSCLSEEAKPGSRLFLQHSPHHLLTRISCEQFWTIWVGDLVFLPSNVEDHLREKLPISAHLKILWP